MTKISQAIVVLQDSDPFVNLKNAVKAGMEIISQYDKASPAYIGGFEENVFRKWLKEWVAQGTQQDTYTVLTSESLKEIEYYANLESVPLNIFSENEEPTILVLGPYEDDRLNALLQHCTKI